MSEKDDISDLARLSIPGKLDPLSGYDVPVQGPYYPQPPWLFSEIKLFVYPFLTHGRDIAKFVPKQLQVPTFILGDLTLGFYFIADFGQSPMGPYRELISAVLSDNNGALYPYLPYCYPNNGAAMSAGREVGGYPKMMGIVDISYNDPYTFNVKNANGIELISGDLTVGEPLFPLSDDAEHSADNLIRDAHSFLDSGLVNFIEGAFSSDLGKMIEDIVEYILGMIDHAVSDTSWPVDARTLQMIAGPGPILPDETGYEPSLTRLIKTNYGVKIHKLSLAEGSFKYGTDPANPLQNLPVVMELSSLYAECEFTLKPDGVELDYLQP